MSRGELTRGTTFDGVIRIVDTKHHVHGYAFEARPQVAATSSESREPFFLALGAAILGGLLLNLMPCIFPVLSLKALTLARAGAADRAVRSEAIGYSAGATTVLVLLGAMIIVLKDLGQSAGWAFQLQNTHVVTMLLLLITAIATNFAGLYELPSLSFSMGSRPGLIGGFGTGALAAFIATPCTGPFMAGALGAALILPAPAGLAVFAGLGLGLSLPFLCLGFSAPLRRLLPKPGAWMLTFRRLLSLPMFATAIGLLWIVGRQAGVSAMTVAISAAVSLGMGLWWFGLRQAAAKGGLPVLVPILIAITLALSGMRSLPSNATSSRLLGSERYTASRLAALRAEHRPVFVFLTADWCLTCKVNEATSLASPEVANAFSRAHVMVLEGDWTRGDREVSRLLNKRGRAGVPLYIWYPADGLPEELPQILTPSMLIEMAHDTQRKS